MADTNPPARGWQRPSDFGSDFARINFQIMSALARISTATLVEIKAVDASAKTVDVLPLVNQVDGFGNGIPHITVYGLPYFQLASGTSAVIIAPTVGDIGVAVFADRDISKVKATGGQSNPGSGRTFDKADGIYFGGVGMLNAAPTQYVELDSTGITLVSPTTVTVTAPNFVVNGATLLNGTLDQTGGGAANMSGSLVVTGNVSASGTSLHTHTHSDPQGGNTGPPN